MYECFKCGVSGSVARLFDAIGSEGVVKICEACSQEENIPVIRKPTTFQLKEEERKQGINERVSRISSFGANESKEITLKEIVDRNFEGQALPEKKPRPDLVDNFHWVIMRARRSKKVTREQLAKDIAESETVLKMAEQGILPEDDYRLINKLENYLNVKLIRGDVKPMLEEKKVLNVPDKFDYQTAQDLTIADLKELKKQREDDGILESDIDLMKSVGEKISAESMKEDSDISVDEIDDLIFGGKKE